MSFILIWVPTFLPSLPTFLNEVFVQKHLTCCYYSPMAHLSDFANAPHRHASLFWTNVLHMARGHSRLMQRLSLHPLWDVGRQQKVHGASVGWVMRLAMLILMSHSLMCTLVDKANSLPHAQLLPPPCCCHRPPMGLFHDLEAVHYSLQHLLAYPRGPHRGWDNHTCLFSTALACLFHRLQPAFPGADRCSRDMPAMFWRWRTSHHVH